MEHKNLFESEYGTTYGLNTNSTSLGTEDSVIEQWYSDPYERPDPEGLSHTQQRRQNLENSLHSQGFAHNRILPIVNWMMRCNGYYRDFDDRKGREKGYCRKRTVEQRDSTTDETLANNKSISCERSPKRVKFTSEPHNHVFEDPIDTSDDVPSTPILQANERTDDISDDKDLDALADLFGDEDQIPTTVQVERIMGTEPRSQDDLTRSPEKINTRDNSPEQSCSATLVEEEPDQSCLGTLAEEEVNADNTEQKHKRKKSSSDRKSLIKALKTRIRFWDIIYGAPPNSCLPDMPSSNQREVEYDDISSTERNPCMSLSQSPGSEYASPFDQDQTHSSPPDSTVVTEPEFSWFHTSTPRMILPLKTQNLLPLHHIVFQGDPCDTEDPTFGLYVVPEHEKMTEDEQREWTELNRQRLRDQERKEREAEYLRRRVSLDLDLERNNVWADSVEDDWRSVGTAGRGRSWMCGSFSNGYRETWKEIEAARREKVDGADAERASGGDDSKGILVKDVV